MGAQAHTIRRLPLDRRLESTRQIREVDEPDDGSAHQRTHRAERGTDRWSHGRSRNEDEQDRAHAREEIEPPGETPGRAEAAMLPGIRDSRSAGRTRISGR